MKKKIILFLLSFFPSFLLFISPVFALTPNDKFFSDQWYLQKIQAPNAWDTTTGSSDVIVAILDTGFDLDHPDLQNQIWMNKNEIPLDGIDNEGNGYIDDVNGYDFIDQDATPEPNPNKSYNEAAVSHGTVIAGMIGAETNNEIGIAGINWKVKLMDVRILGNDGSGNSKTARKGIEYAVKNGAKIINLSFTGFDNDPELEDAIKTANAAGVLVVAAVGNTEGGGINVDAKPIYPACDGHGNAGNGIIGVAATNELDGKAIFSNYGSNCTDLSAPGVDILSTVYQNDTWLPFSNGYYQDGWSGTSMAAPIVSGSAALILSLHPTLNPEQIKNILRLSADPIHETGLAQGKMGAGRLNIANALILADQIYPPEASAGSLIKLSCGAATETNDPCRAVYFYAQDGKRHAFPNEKIYFSWYKDYANVKEVSQTFMSTLSLGKNVTYHPGLKLVKFQSVPIVYAVEAKGVLRAIGTEEIAAALYGTDWNKKVDDISDAFFSNYSFGAKIESAADFSVTAVKDSISGLNANF